MQLRDQKIQVRVHDNSGGSLNATLAGVLSMADEPESHANLSVVPELSKGGTCDIFVVLGEASREMLKLVQDLYQEAYIVVIQEKRTTPTLIELLKAGADDVFYTSALSVDGICTFLRIRIERQVIRHNRGHDGLVTVGDLSIDPLARRVMIGPKVIALSPTEFRLLYMLAKDVGVVVTHELLLSRVWGPGHSGEREILRAALWRLRHKLEDPSGHQWISTSPGVGYMIDLPQDTKVAG